MMTKTGSFSKVRKLIRVLKKCSGKAVVGDDEALISPAAAKILASCILAAVFAALAVGAWYIQPFLDWLIGLKSLSQSLMLLLLIVSFVLSVKDLVTVLYAADDLEQLLPMPFSAGQIVMAKVAAAASFPVILSLIVLNGVCLGYGIRAKAGAAFFIGTVLSSVLVPITGICAATLLVVIVFRVFGFIRNRDITVALGGIFSFLFMFGYILFSNRLHQDDSERAAAAALGFLSAVSAVFPNISLMSRFMFEGSIPGLLGAIAIPALLFVLALLAVKAFYFDTALAMSSSGSGNRAVTREALGGRKKSSALRALTGYEAKSTRRNPAYLIYGFAMSLLWPLLVMVPLFLGENNFFSGTPLPMRTVQTLFGAVTLALTASCFACGFSVLPGTVFTREGGSFAAIRALPVDPKDYCRSKRRFSLLVCSLGSTLYVLIAGIAGAAIGAITLRNLWLVPAGAAVSFSLNVILVDLLMLKDSRRPRLTWDSEAEFARKLSWVNILAVVAGVMVLVLFMLTGALSPLFAEAVFARIAAIACAVAGAAVLVLAPVIDHFAVAKAAKNLMNVEV